MYSKNMESSHNILVCNYDQNHLEWMVVDVDSKSVVDNGSYLVRPIKQDSSEGNLDQDIVFEEEENATSDLPSISYEESYLFISGQVAFSFKQELPFDDIKKARQVLPLQIEDLIPFVEDPHHIAITQESENDNGSFAYSICCISENLLNEILDSTKTHNVEPEEAYCSLSIFDPATNLISDNSSPHLLLFELDESLILILCHNDKILHSREFLLPKEESTRGKVIEAQLSTSIPQLLVEHSIPSEELATTHLVLGQSDVYVSDKYSNRPIQFDLKDTYLSFVSKGIAPRLAFSALLISTHLNELTWSTPNLRKGKFKYVAPLTNIRESLYDERLQFYLLLVFASVYAVYSYLVFGLKKQNIENQIASVAAQTLGTTYPKGTEIIQLENAIYDTESTLGSLSKVNTLSALEWLGVLSETIPQSVALSVSSIAFDEEGMSVKGTVPNIRSSGRLDSLLSKLGKTKPETFCKTTVSTDSSRRIASSNERSVTLNIELCKTDQNEQ